MFSNTKFLLFCLSLFCFAEAGAKEYKDLGDYLKDHPTGLHNGMDGNWLKADRDQNEESWNRANQINLSKQQGYLEYRDIYQRCDFYKWFQYQTDSLGFETRWAGAARETTTKLKNLLNPVAVLAGNSNAEIKQFVKEGNGIIFDDIWPDLRSLFIHQPLTGTAAETWDGHLLLKEQHVIDPYYRKLSNSAWKKLQRLLRRETALSKILSGYEFEGNLLNVSDRWFYGMKMMKYKNPDINK